MYYDINPICYHCEMFSFKWTADITFVRGVTRRMTVRIFTQSLRRPSILRVLRPFIKSPRTQSYDTKTTDTNVNKIHRIK